MMEEEEPRYSDKYYDEFYEYRHVILPKSWPGHNNKLLTEVEWRNMNVVMSRGWQVIIKTKSDTRIWPNNSLPHSWKKFLVFTRGGGGVSYSAAQKFFGEKISV